jgi:hypothetical protein
VDGVDSRWKVSMQCERLEERLRRWAPTMRLVSARVTAACASLTSGTGRLCSLAPHASAPRTARGATQRREREPGHRGEGAHGEAVDVEPRALVVPHR